MIRIAHLVGGLPVGGCEQVVLDLCRHRDRSEFECLVAASEDGPMADEIRRTGSPVITGPKAMADAVWEADLVNMHWCGYDTEMLGLVQAAGKPHVLTIHWPMRLPDLPCVKICTSQFVCDFLEHQEQCVVIPNGVDVERFAPPAGTGRARRREEVILTRVCRPSKCAFYFWIVMKQVLDCWPQSRLWIVGNEENSQSDSDRLRFLGIRRDVPEILAETDLFVYTPSPGWGSQDLVVMEAAAAGVPCVVSDVEAVRPSVEDGVNGFRVPFGRERAFVEKVGLLIEDSALREGMGQAALRIARERFDVRHVARRYEQVYRAVLGIDPGCPVEGQQYLPSE